jgi:hypothetical protein
MTNDPVLIAYGAQRRQNGKRWWTRVGCAYPHETGAGLTVVLDLLPLDGRIYLFERDDQDDERILTESRALKKRLSSRKPA